MLWLNKETIDIMTITFFIFGFKPISYVYRFIEKLKIVKLTMDQEKSLQNVVNNLADTREWPLQYLDYQYKVLKNDKIEY